jgi:FkbM family methyltransferase
MKLRIWYGIYKALGSPRLTIPYDTTGWISVDERDLLQREILMNGFYEPEVWEHLAQFITDDEVFWDVGAHIGSFSIRALLNDAIKEVHAFEPDNFQAQVLQFNLALNRRTVHLHQCALSDQPRTVAFYHGPEANTGLSSLIPFAEEAKPAFHVECQRADHFVYHEGLRPPTLMKIDVEGWELQVLQGSRRIFDEHPPKAIVLESECDRTGKLVNAEVTDFLNGFGYRVNRIPRPSGFIDHRENYLATRA